MSTTKDDASDPGVRPAEGGDGHSLPEQGTSVLLWLGKPRSELRDWSTYRTLDAYYRDHQGTVPTQMIIGIGRRMHERVLTFAEAYQELLDAGNIMHVDLEDGCPPLAGYREA